MSFNTLFESVWLLNNCSKGFIIMSFFGPLRNGLFQNNLVLRVKFCCMGSVIFILCKQIEQ